MLTICMTLQSRFKTTPIAPEKRLLTPKQSVLCVGLSVDAIYEMTATATSLILFGQD